MPRLSAYLSRSTTSETKNGRPDGCNSSPDGVISKKSSTKNSEEPANFVSSRESAEPIDEASSQITHKVQQSRNN